MTDRQRKSLTTLLAAIAAPFAVWALTGAIGYSKRAWDGKESVSAHDADIGTMRAERRSAVDSLRNLHALDSAFMQRILDATCADRANIRACRP